MQSNSPTSIQFFPFVVNNYESFCCKGRIKKKEDRG